MPTFAIRVRRQISFLQGVMRHPLNRHRRFAALRRWLIWHIVSRLAPGPIAVDFVDRTRLLISPGMRGASENIHTGLSEFEDMAFALHLLRACDTFVDVGSNVGVYTILAAGVRQSRCIAMEPVPSTFQRLLHNIWLNDVGGLVEAHNVGVGDRAGRLAFTADLDTTNHVLAEGEKGVSNSVEIPASTLDSILHGREPVLVKIDVEGYEAQVLAGGKEAFARRSLLGVIIETNDCGRRYGTSAEVLRREMQEYGFAWYDYLPFERRLVPANLNGRQAGRNSIYIREWSGVEERLSEAEPFLVHGWKV